MPTPVDDWVTHGLPLNPLQNGYSYEIGDTSMTTSMDSGIEKKRNRYTKGYDTISAQYLLTSAEWALLVSLFKTDTKYGTLVFAWPNPSNTSLRWNVRFINAPKAAPAGPDFMATVNMKVIP